MSFPLFDRKLIRFKPLADRKNKVAVPADLVMPDSPAPPLPAPASAVMAEAVQRIRDARKKGRPVICAFGAHAIKNGLGPVLSALMSEGWITHLATNGAGIIHDWEIAFQARTSEDVRANVARGEFGIWEETGRLINLALLVGAYQGLGYGQSIGSLIVKQGLEIPGAAELGESGAALLREDPERAAAAADLLAAVRAFRIQPGFMSVEHPFRKYSVQAAAFERNVPFTGHPSIGHDIIYAHPMNSGGAIGRTGTRDFLTYAASVSRLEGGVYLSVGSAVMSPMIFEKSLSMSRNVAIQSGASIENHFILVVDLAESTWDWQKDGEPPSDNPAYYLRYCKTFARMGGTMRYLSADNRRFFPALLHFLRGT
ncbi:MAG TPA: hypothetical protein VMV03_14865 [Spirochaetia bacterium]|nr:hypothetical protein [Spirochaetia bacterium]